MKAGIVPPQHRIRAGSHGDQVKAIEEALQHTELCAPRRATVTRCLVDDGCRPIRVIDRERVIQVAEDPTAAQHKGPGLHPVGRIGRALEAGLIVRDHPVQVIVPRDRFGHGIVEIEDRDVGVRVPNTPDVILVVDGDQVPVGQRLLCLGEHVDEVVLPVEEDAAVVKRVDLVGDLVIDVIEAR